MSFYEGLLGWAYRQMENSPLSDYAMIDAGGLLIGGLRRVPMQARTSISELSSPVLYFSVQDLEAKIQRAKDLGAELVGSIVRLGNDRGRYQWVKDREGNLIGLWAAK